HQRARVRADPRCRRRQPLLSRRRAVPVPMVRLLPAGAGLRLPGLDLHRAVDVDGDRSHARRGPIRRRGRALSADRAAPGAHTRPRSAQRARTVARHRPSGRQRAMMRFRKGDGERSGLFTRRALLLGGTQAVLLSALVGRLYQLQVIDTQRFSTLAEENRINLRLLPPSRGLIFDRTGQPLAVNRNNFRVMVTTDRGRGAAALVERLDQILNLGETEKNRLLRELRRSRNAQPAVVRENLGWDEVARVESNAPDLPGVFIDLGQTRDYPEGELMSHIIGYTGRVADEDLAGRDDPVLQLATLRFGKKGGERSLE